MSSSSRIRAQQVILELIRQAGGELIGKTKLFKAFYFAHLMYADKAPGLLTDWPIVRMPQGPGIDRSHELLDDLFAGGQLTWDTVHEGPFPAVRYRITGKPFPANVLEPDAVVAVRQASEFVRDKTATELSELTHEYSRSWNEAKNGDAIDIYIDLIPDEEYEARERRLDVLSHDIAAVFGDATC